MTDIEYSQSIPDEVLDVLKPLVEKWKYLIPTWCHVCYVNFIVDGNDEFVASNTNGTCSTSEKYRSAYIDIYPQFISDDKESREVTILHEILHISLDYIYEYGRKVIDAALDDCGYKDQTMQEYEDRLECVVVDLTRSIYHG